MMPTDKPRIQTALDSENNSLEMHEDLYLSKISNERISETISPVISHDDAWD